MASTNSTIAIHYSETPKSRLSSSISAFDKDMQRISFEALSSTPRPSPVPAHCLPLKKRRRNDAFGQFTMFSTNGLDEPIDLSKKPAAITVPPLMATVNDSAVVVASSFSPVNTSSEYSFKSALSSSMQTDDDRKTEENSNDNAADSDATTSTSSASNKDKTMYERELLFIAKNRNICSIFKNETLRKELVDRLLAANVDEIDCHSLNAKMVRTFVPVERTESEQVKRERNTEAARVSRRKRAILEKIVCDIAAEKEKEHEKLLMQKAAMMMYCMKLDSLL